jgi:hypothetical protein
MNFDDTRWALLNMIQVMTFERWPELLLTAYRVSGGAAFIYFFFLVLFASFLVPNLALAVINDKYNESQRRHAYAEEIEYAKSVETQRLKEVASLRIRIISNNNNNDNNIVIDDSSGSPTQSAGLTSARRLQQQQQSEAIPMLTVQHLRAPISESMFPNTSKSEHTMLTVQSVSNSDPTPMRSPLQVPIVSDDDEARSNSSNNSRDGRVAEQLAIPDFNLNPPIFTWQDFRDALHRITQGYALPEDDDEVYDGIITPFVFFIIGCIVLNTILLASQHYHQPDWLDTLSSVANIIFTVIFAIELVVVLIAVGFKRFVTDPWLMVDCIIVVVSVIELCVSGSSVVAAFRALRLLRVLKLLRNFPSLRALVRVIFTAVSDTLYLNAIMLLFLIVGALAGKQIFGTADLSTRQNFRDFYQSFLTVFQIVTTDGWVDVMWATMEATSPAAALFYITVIILGTYVILSLFLSILISGFEKQGEADEYEETILETADNAERMALQRVIDRRLANSNDVAVTHDDLTKFRVSTRAKEILQVPYNIAVSRSDELLGSEMVCRRCYAVKAEVLPPFPGDLGVSSDDLHSTHCFAAGVRVAKLRVLDTLEAYARRMSDLRADFNRDQVMTVMEQARGNGMLKCTKEDDLLSWDELIFELSEQRAVLELRVGEEQLGHSLLGYVTSGLPRTYSTNGGASLFLFGPDNFFRVMCYRTVRHPVFETAVMVVVILSSLALVLDNPRDNNEELADVLEAFNYIFAIAFGVEMLMKIIAFGLIARPGAYLRSGWNWLDAIVTIVSIASLSTTGSIAALRAFRTLRALRPLRAINRNRGLKTIFVTLLQSMKGIAHVAMLSSLNYLIFGILTVQLLSGALYSCNDMSVTVRLQCTGNFTAADGVVIARAWENSDRNYDNIVSSMLTLFQVSSGDNWGDVMYAAIDSTGNETAPRADAHPEMGLLFVVFYIIGNFLMLNLFVGVVIFNFNHVKGRIEGLALLTERQKQWVEAQQMILNFRPEVPMVPGNTRVSRWCHFLVQHPRFQLSVALTIFANMVVMTFDHYDQSEAWDDAQMWCNALFTLLFLVEAGLKIAAHGLQYFRVGWNRFDLLLVIIGIVSVVMSFASLGLANPGILSLLRVLRIFRVLRTLRLFKRAQHVRMLVDTLWFSLPSIANIALFMAMIYFVFATVGVQVFANVEPGEFLNDDFFNYRNFASAMQLMFIFTTGEGWSDVMYDCMKVNQDCTVACGEPVTSAVFHVSFVTISAFVISNLFIAIVLDNFATTMRMEQSQLKMSVLARFTELWGDVDPGATMMIHTSRLPALLKRLGYPLGLIRQTSRVELLRRLMRYRIPDREGSVHFIEVLVPLASFASDVTLDERDSRKQQEHVYRAFPELLRFPQTRYNNMPTHAGHYFAQSHVAAAFRGRKQRLVANAIRASELERLNGIVALDPNAPEPYLRRRKHLQRSADAHPIVFKAPADHDAQELSLPLDLTLNRLDVRDTVSPKPELLDPAA